MDLWIDGLSIIVSLIVIAATIGWVALVIKATKHGAPRRTKTPQKHSIHDWQGRI